MHRFLRFPVENEAYILCPISETEDFYNTALLFLVGANYTSPNSKVSPTSNILRYVTKAFSADKFYLKQTILNTQIQILNCISDFIMCFLTGVFPGIIKPAQF